MQILMRVINVTTINFLIFNEFFQKIHENNIVSNKLYLEMFEKKELFPYFK